MESDSSNSKSKQVSGQRMFDLTDLEPELIQNENKTLMVLVLSFVMMAVELVFGLLTDSMALLADGWHMLSHTAALGISYLTYRLARSKRFKRHFCFGAGKMIPLGGFTSALLLGGVSFFMIFESVMRFRNPVAIAFDMAILVAIIGLVVNVISAWILGGTGAEHSHSHSSGPVKDTNLKGAYYHVLADALTSLLAIIALLGGKYLQVVWLDPMVGVLGGVMVLRWGVLLLRESSWELLDAKVESPSHEEIKSTLLTLKVELHDARVWSVAPERYLAQLMISDPSGVGVEECKRLLKREFPRLGQVVIEVH